MNYSPKKGDVIYADRGLYRHYGIYDNTGSVIHFSPDKGVEISAENARIRETTLAEFLRGDGLYVDRRIRALFPPDEIVRRARAFIGELRGEYSLLFFNCEHFARWCATGELVSKQVKQGAIVAGAIAATATVAIIAKAITEKGKSEDS